MWHLIVLSVTLFNPHMHTAGIDDIATASILWSFNSRGACMTALARVDPVREVLVIENSSIHMMRACIPDMTLAAQSAAAPNEKSGIYFQLKK